jgi:hypothetical protein
MSLSDLYENHVEAYLHDCDRNIIVKLNKFYHVLSYCAQSHFVRKLNKIIVFSVSLSQIVDGKSLGLNGKPVGIYSMIDKKYYFCNPFYVAVKDEEWFKNIMYRG